MSFLFCDKDGNKCLAKTVYTCSFATCMYKILFAGITIYGFELSDSVVDYAGLVQVLTVAGAAYFGRSHTKANS